jgi:hypothetical protein
MFRRRRSEDDWDDDILWEEDFGSPRRSRLRVVLAVLGVLAAVVAIGALGTWGVGQVAKRSPARTAETWLEHLVTMDGNSLARATCSEMPVEEQLRLQMTALLGGIFDLANSSVLDAFPGVDNLVDLVEEWAPRIDTSELEYETIAETDTASTVTVIGPAYVDIGRFSYTHRVDETWSMIWEGDRWKWCGR